MRIASIIVPEPRQCPAPTPQPSPLAPFSLSDSQLDTLMLAARALVPSARGAFLELVAQGLRREPLVGDGTLSRAIRAAQAEFIDRVAIGVLCYRSKHSPREDNPRRQR
jgi:hypothetical protein